MAQLMSNTKTYEKGIYISEYVIEDISENDNNTYSKDINIILKLKKEIGSLEISRTLYLNGNLFKNDTIPPNLSNLLYATGILDDDNMKKIIDNFSKNRIDKTVKDYFIGKKIKCLEYVSGTYESSDGLKPNYKIWNGIAEGFNYPNTFDINTADDVILELFKDKLKSEYPPKYTPEILNNDEPLDNNAEEEDIF